MNIVLIGFMGTGKSEVGQRISNRLSMKFVDTDTLIEKAEKMKIADIFSQKGENYFRDLETGVIKTLSEYDNFVISTGGGMILRSQNVTMLKKLGSLILLWSDHEAIFERLKHSKDRPFIEGDIIEKFKKILVESTPFYNKAADFKIDTSELSINRVVEEIIEWIKK